MTSAESYPFDPELEDQAETLSGMEKLRAVRDRPTAQMLYELWSTLEGRQGEIARAVQAEEAQKRREYRQSLSLLGQATQSGKYGQMGKELFSVVTGDGADLSVSTLEKLARLVRVKGLKRT